MSGRVSRPSVIAWTTIRSTPASRAIRMSASRCAWLAWTPPGRRPGSAGAGCRSRPRSRAACSAGLRGERAVGDGLVDPDQHLRHPPAGAEVQVPHLASCPAARPGGRRAGRRRRCGCPTPRRRGGPASGVRARLTALPGPGGRDAEPVDDDQDEGPGARAGSAGCADDGGEGVRVEAGAAHQGAVDVGLRAAARARLGRDAAAVEHPQRRAVERARRRRRARSAHASWAISGVAVRPVPIAQIGS